MLDSRIRTIKDGRWVRTRREWGEQYVASKTIKRPGPEVVEFPRPRGQAARPRRDQAQEGRDGLPVLEGAGRAGPPATRRGGAEVTWVVPGKRRDRRRRRCVISGLNWIRSLKQSGLRDCSLLWCGKFPTGEGRWSQESKWFTPRTTAFSTYQCGRRFGSSGRLSWTLSTFPKPHYRWSTGGELQELTTCSTTTPWSSWSPGA